MEKKNRTADGNPHTPNLGISLIPIVAIFVLLYGSLRIFHLDVQIPLIFASIIAAFIAVVILKNKWDTIEKGIIDSIQNAMQAILIACFIGMIIGSWIAGGIVPSLIYYGLKILSPKFFLVTCLLVCSIVRKRNLNQNSAKRYWQIWVSKATTKELATVRSDMPQSLRLLRKPEKKITCTICNRWLRSHRNIYEI